MNNSEKIIRKDNSYLLLLLAGISLFLSSGKWIIPIMAWLFPVFAIRFLHDKSIFKGYIIISSISIIPVFFGLQGMVPVPLPEYIVTIIIGSYISFIPFMLNRWITSKLKGFSSTIFLPVLVVSFEFLSSISNPFGTWNSSAYTQLPDLSVFQVTSVTGIWGIIFLIFWVASAVCWLWERDFKWYEDRAYILTVISVLILINSFGYVRLIFFKPDSETVRVSALTSPVSMEIRKAMIDPLITGEIELKNLNWEKITKAGVKVGEDLINRTIQASNTGSKIILWSEAAVHIEKKDEGKFISRCSQVARDHQIYLGITLFSYRHFNPDKLPDNKMVENKLILLKPDGNIAWTYNKVIPVPGIEEIITLKGDGKIPFVDTEYGRIGGSICFDMDFPKYLTQAGKNNIDILLVPGADWKEITPGHTYMASVRAIENGFSLIRCVQSGFSAGFDYQGRLLGGMTYFNTDNYSLHVDLPVKGVKTIYPFIGDLFAYLSISGAFIFILYAFINRKKL